MKVNGYPDWMLAAAEMSDQLDLGQENGMERIEGVE